MWRWYVVLCYLIVADGMDLLWHWWDLREKFGGGETRQDMKMKEEESIVLSDNERFWGAWGQANALYTRWADAHAVNYYLLFVLYALDGQAAMTQKMICDCTGLTKQTVNSVIRTLKGEGYVVLSPGQGDKREKQVALTEKGAAYSREVLEPLHELERTVLARMGNGRVQQMINDITLFNTVFEKEMEKRLS